MRSSIDPKRRTRISLADNPQTVRELRICQKLGISYKRWLGWEPSYRVERDGHRRITGYTPETEWDATEREWMLALDEYERTLCPRCGMPVSICHDELAPTKYASEGRRLPDRPDAPHRARRVPQGPFRGIRHET